MSLRERVARALCEAHGDDQNAFTYSVLQEKEIPNWDFYYGHFADAAISIIRPAVLEEAAKVASRMYRKGQIGSDIAAALRALAKEGE